ncbi:FliM/FliN family flagellar motor switch protein [Serratia marcescens]|uniref:FliM/FliN family flagellar motor switch protein n=1 Tax=Serratia marcescens TaxID=615 RepID=UPI000D729E90|nr:FliM/FliN family flagellar motor switch protein [Serratia marcescens]AWO77464.1 YscQ/HrcQ family type III secretion apparatus protein [Serratia marcescens]HDU5650209.1 FliM/FliN family flagellar motor switch protein [Klebsiella aerogenes]
MSGTLPLRLRSLSRTQAQTQNQLAAGYHYPFTLGDEYGELWLLPATPQPPQEASHWRCALGDFSLSAAEPLLNLLSLSPCPPAIPEPHGWQWALYNQHLSPALAQLFGELRPGARPTTADTVARLYLTLGELHADAQLYLDHAQLRRWLRNPGWRTTIAPLPATLVITQPLRLASISLLPAQIATLAVGDLLVPPLCNFAPDGQGCLIIAGLRLSGTLQPCCNFLINHLEPTPLNTAEEPLPLDTPAEQATVETGITLSALPLTLEVRCGRTLTTLGELQQLQVGSVLTLDNIIPGEAGLYHGDTPIARGELVEVEGRLGLQLTQMLLTPPQETP